MKTVIWQRCNYTKTLPENIKTKITLITNSFPAELQFCGRFDQSTFSHNPCAAQRTELHPCCLDTMSLHLFSLTAAWGVGGVKKVHIWNCSESASSSHNNWDHWISPNQLAVVPAVGLTWEALSPCPPLLSAAPFLWLHGLILGQVFTEGNQRNLTKQAGQSVSDVVEDRKNGGVSPPVQWKKKS